MVKPTFTSEGNDYGIWSFQARVYLKNSQHPICCYGFKSRDNLRDWLRLFIPQIKDTVAYIEECGQMKPGSRARWQNVKLIIPISEVDHA